MLAGLVAAALIVVPPSTLAHAFVDRAVPAVGSTVHGSPVEVMVWFTQELEPAFSTIKVEDGKGNAVASADKAVDPSTRTMLRLPLPPLAPGPHHCRGGSRARMFRHDAGDEHRS